MSKTVKMVLYGKPGEGKSTFASKTPYPFYLCTDSNFEWLGLPEDQHIKLSSWKQAKQVINDIVLNKPEYKKYKTIVVDLIETLYVWAEDEFCKRENITHLGDYKSMGAGYSVVRKEFFAQMSKLLSIDKNVILISHEADKIGKTKAGADTYTYIPSDKMSLTKQWNDIEGEVRYFLRCFSADEEVDGRLKKKRYLSLIPGQGEYGICRGADEETWPRECELSWKVFSAIVGLESEPQATVEAEEATKKGEHKETKATEARQKEETAESKPAAKTADEDKAPAEEKNEKGKADEAEAKMPDPEPRKPEEQPVDTSSFSQSEREQFVLSRLALMKKAKK